MKVPAVARRAGWNLADQMVVSLTNAVLSFMVANAVSPESFGGFAVAFTVFALVIGASRAVATSPLNIRFTDVEPDEAARAAAQATGTALAIGFVTGIGCVLVGLLLDGPTAEALIAMGVVMPAVITQDALRYVFFSRQNPAGAAVNDAIWTVLQLGAVGILLYSGSGAVWPLVLAWGGSAAVAAVLGARRAATLPDVRRTPDWLREHRNLTGYLFASFATAHGANQGAMLVIAAVGSALANGALRGAAILLGPTSILSSAAMTFAIPEFSRRRTSFSNRQWLISAVGVSGAVSFLGLCWGMIFLLMPDSVGEFVLSDTWQNTSELLLAAVVAQVFACATIGPVVMLYAIDKASATLVIQIVLGSLTFLGGVGGVIIGGGPGAQWGFAIANAIVVPFWFFRLWRELRKRGEVSDLAEETDGDDDGGAAADPEATRALPARAMPVTHFLGDLDNPSMATMVLPRITPRAAPRPPDPAAVDGPTLVVPSGRPSGPVPLAAVPADGAPADAGPEPGQPEAVEPDPAQQLPVVQAAAERTQKVPAQDAAADAPPTQALSAQALSAQALSAQALSAQALSAQGATGPAGHGSSDPEPSGQDAPAQDPAGQGATALDPAGDGIPAQAGTSATSGTVGRSPAPPLPAPGPQPAATAPGPGRPGPVPHGPQLGGWPPAPVPQGPAPYGSAQRGPARPGAAHHGPVQHGPVQHGPVQHGPVQHGPVQHGPVQHGPVQHGPAVPGPAHHGPAVPGPAHHGPAQPGPLQHGPAQHGPALPGPAHHGPAQPGPAQHGPAPQPGPHGRPPHGPGPHDPTPQHHGPAAQGPHPHGPHPYGPAPQGPPPVPYPPQGPVPPRPGPHGEGPHGPLPRGPVPPAALPPYGPARPGPAPYGPGPQRRVTGPVPAGSPQPGAGPRPGAGPAGPPPGADPRGGPGAPRAPFPPSGRETPGDQRPAAPPQGPGGPPPQGFGPPPGPPRGAPGNPLFTARTDPEDGAAPRPRPRQDGADATARVDARPDPAGTAPGDERTRQDRPDPAGTAPGDGRGRHDRPAAASRPDPGGTAPAGGQEDRPGAASRPQPSGPAPGDERTRHDRPAAAPAPGAANGGAPRHPADGGTSAPARGANGSTARSDGNGGPDADGERTVTGASARDGRPGASAGGGGRATGDSPAPAPPSAGVEETARVSSPSRPAGDAD